MKVTSLRGSTDETERCLRTSSVGIVLLAGFQGGGAERVAAALLEHPPAGLATHLITNTPPESDRYAYVMPEAARRTVLGADVDERRLADVGWLRSIAHLGRLVVRARGEIRRIGPSAVLSLLTTANLLTIVACAGTRVRVVISERSDTSRERHPLPIRVARRLLYRFADVVTANTQVAIDDMARYVPASRLVHVPNPVTSPAEPADPGASQRVVTVGRLVENKDHATVVDAFVRLDVDDWHLTLVGDGPLRETLVARADRAGVSDRVTFPGYVLDPTEHYATAAIFVLSSRYEGMSNALLEAMAHGVVCVVADELPGALELVDDGVTGFAFRTGDADDLARVLGRLATDPGLRRRVGAAGRERVAELDPAVISRRWAALLLGDGH